MNEEWWPDNWHTFRKVCGDVANYLRSMKQQPGAGHWYRDSKGRALLLDLLRVRWADLTGSELLNFVDNMDRIYREWENARKANYKLLRDSKTIMATPVDGQGQRTLLPGPEQPSVVVYAHLATIPARPYRIVKLGYTADEINRYLASKRITCNPQLLGTRPGTKSIEDKWKQHWAHILVDGDEWFDPAPELFEFLRKELVVLVAVFNSLTKTAIQMQPVIHTYA